MVTSQNRKVAQDIDMKLMLKCSYVPRCGNVPSSELLLLVASSPDPNKDAPASDT